MIKLSAFHGGSLCGKGISSTQKATSLGAAAGVTIPPDWSALRPISHGLDAISVGLILMRPLLGHDGLTDWDIRIAASLVALAEPF